jgi:hypothetical protein
VEFRGVRVGRFTTASEVSRGCAHNPRLRQADAEIFWARG